MTSQRALLDAGSAMVKGVEKAIQMFASENTDTENVQVVKEGFCNEFTKDERRSEFSRIRAKYPDRIPVICERAFNSSVPQVDKRKFLVPRDITAGQFLYVVRQRIRLQSGEAMFIFVDGVLPRTDASMDEIYNLHKSEDGFLYLTYSGENTFG